MIRNKIQSKTFLIGIILLIFSIVFSLISLVNHYYFRTAALDLGLNTHAVYCYSRFIVNHYTLSYGGSEINFLGDHFSPITVLYVPFYYVFGSYTLLIVQILSILFGGLGIYKYSKLFFPDSNLPVLLLLHFFGIWGIYSALAYDFHNNVVAAMLVPWLFLFYKTKQRYYFLLIYFLIILTKENMILWMLFILIGLLFVDGKFNFREKRKFELPLILFTLVIFVLVMAIIMPYFQGPHVESQLHRYSYLGNDISQVIHTVISKPVYFISLFFQNHLGNSNYDGIKTETYLMLLFSGGLALVLRPAYLVMILPIIAQKMLSPSYGTWGINGQYSIEFVPILSLALIDLLARLRNRKWNYSIIIFVLMLTYVATFTVFGGRKSKWYNKTNTVFYDKRHYETGLNIQSINQKLSEIPDGVTLSVSSAVAPHLGRREKMYLFPHVKDAEYIVLLYGNSTYTYPLNDEEFEKKVAFYLNSGSFKKTYDQHNLMILKRVQK